MQHHDQRGRHIVYTVAGTQVPPLEPTTPETRRNTSHVQGVIFVGTDTLGLPSLVAIAVISVYLAVLLAHNLEIVLRGDKNVSSSELVEIVLLVLICIVTYGDGKGDPLVGYVTLEDRVGFVMILSYTAYYGLRGLVVFILGTVFPTLRPSLPTNMSPVNPIIAGLMLASMRIHVTLDNAYTVAGAWMLGTRLLNKISTCSFAPSDQGHWGFFVIDLMLDSLILSALVFFGVIQYYNVGPLLTWLYVLQGTLAGVTVNMMVQSLEPASATSTTP